MRRREFVALCGGVVAWARATRAEQADRTYRIAYLALTPGEDATLIRVLQERLKELGYVQGGNLSFEYRSAQGHPQQLQPLASELVRAGPDVLVAGYGTLAAKAAKTATSTIPIVFMDVGDPVGTVIVVSLSRPGGNITGLTSQASEVPTKRLQLLLELIPRERTVTVMMNPDTPSHQLALEQIRRVVAVARTPLEVLEARTPDQVSPGRFEGVIQRGAAGLLVLDDPLTRSLTRNIADAAAQFRLPAIYAERSWAVAGGLMSYGVDRRQMSRQAAEYVDRILKGARPADLPVEQPTKFEFVLNLKVAKALGIEIPALLPAQADEVIE